jgi:hypothetical protein
MRNGRIMIFFILQETLRRAPITIPDPAKKEVAVDTAKQPEGEAKNIAPPAVAEPEASVEKEVKESEKAAE